MLVFNQFLFSVLPLTMQLYNSLVPRPHPLTRKRVWWSTIEHFLGCAESTILNLNKWTIISSCHIVLFRWLASTLVCIVALFHWLVQDRYCWLGTTNSGSPDPFPRERVGSGHETNSTSILYTYDLILSSLVVNTLCHWATVYYIIRILPLGMFSKDCMLWLQKPDWLGKPVWLVGWLN